MPGRTLDSVLSLLRRKDSLSRSLSLPHGGPHLGTHKSARKGSRLCLIYQTCPLTSFPDHHQSRSGSRPRQLSPSRSQAPRPQLPAHMPGRTRLQLDPASPSCSQPPHQSPRWLPFCGHRKVSLKSNRSVTASPSGVWASRGHLPSCRPCLALPRVSGHRSQPAPLACPPSSFFPSLLPQTLQLTCVFLRGGWRGNWEGQEPSLSEEIAGASLVSTVCEMARLSHPQGGTGKDGKTPRPRQTPQVSPPAGGKGPEQGRLEKNLYHITSRKSGSSDL